jgi:hypothetical protein
MGTDGQQSLAPRPRALKEPKENVELRTYMELAARRAD